MRRSVPSLALLSLFVLAAALLVGLLTEPDETPYTSAESESQAAKTRGHPRLAARGVETTRPSSEDNEAPKRRWTLEVVFAKAQPRRSGVALRLALLEVEHPSEGGTTEASSFAGMEILATRRRGGSVTNLGRTTLDSRGRARLDVSALDSLNGLERTASVITVQFLRGDVHLAPRPRYVQGRKYPYGVQTLRLPGRVKDGDVTMLLVMEAYTGGTITGHAVLPGGAPARDARVILRGRGKAWAGDTCTDQAGHFAFAVGRAGVFDIEVRASNGARAQRGGVELPTERDVELPLFELKGVGRFAGRITYPDGSPAEGVSVELDAGVLRPGSEFDPLPCGYSFYDAAVRTDADGRFALFSPQGKYAESGRPHASVSVPGLSHVKPRSLRRWFIDGPQPDLEAVVHGHKVRVRVQDEQGEAIPQAHVQFWPPDGEEPHLVVGRRAHRASLMTDAHGRGALWLPRGSTWRVLTILEGATPQTVRLQVPNQRNESELRITLKPLADPVLLSFEMKDPDGNALFPTVVTIRTAGGAELFSRRVVEPGFTYAVAPDRTYQVEARALEDPRWKGKGHAYGYSSTRRWMPATTRIAIGASGRHRAVLSTVEAAHLEVALTRAPGLSAEELPWLIGIELEHPASGRRVSPSGPTRPWNQMRSAKVLDRQLEPGTWLVRLKAPSLKPVTRRVHLEAGAVGRVEFLLEKR